VLKRRRWIVCDEDLNSAGWVKGDAADFLEMNEEERRLLDSNRLTPMDIAIQEAKDNHIQKLEEELDWVAGWLQEVSMIDEHDDNGPGIVRCPVCDGCSTMKWKNGVQLDVEVKHDERCPITWAMNRLS
jgi:hypothetical protein